VNAGVVICGSGHCSGHVRAKCCRIRRRGPVETVQQTVSLVFVMAVEALCGSVWRDSKFGRVAVTSIDGAVMKDNLFYQLHWVVLACITQYI
jgi:hypothetical protein